MGLGFHAVRRGSVPLPAPGAPASQRMSFGNTISLRPWLASTIASAFWKRSLACGAASFRSTVLVTRPVFASCASTAFRAATCLGLGLG